ncbi:MAG: hypothetical protein GXP19_09095 [Gammaproteobacteria bacterium]|nr:hypothetical protein [Gammaproteobacteria bacterium]
MFITASQVDVYWWEDKYLNGPLEIHLGRTGIHALGKHLRVMPEMLTYLIIDVVEEEFRNETIPHLFGRDKKQLTTRRLNQYFRTSTYRGALNLGREKSGRRDDKVLFTALTNSDVFKPWVDCLLRHKVPIVGVYSPSVLGGRMLQKLNINHQNVLLITHQKSSGIRQTFFHKKRLKLSRLVPVAGLNEQQYAGGIFSEIEKTRRYLSRLQLLNFDEVLDVCFVSDKTTAGAISKNNQDTELTRLHVVTVGDLESEFGSNNAGGLRHAEGSCRAEGSSYRAEGSSHRAEGSSHRAEGSSHRAEGSSHRAEGSRYCDQVYARILSLKRPTLNYAEPAIKKYKTFREIRMGMHASSTLLLVAAIIWSSMNIIEGFLLENYSGEIRASSVFIQGEYQKVLANTPETPIPPVGLKESVDIAKSLKDGKAMPGKLMRAISTGLNVSTTLGVEKIQWLVSSDPYAPVELENKNRLNKPIIPATTPSEADSMRTLYQIALIKGRLGDFSGGYRKAFNAVDKLASVLRRQPDIVDVQTMKLPFDVNSKSDLHGHTGVNVTISKAGFVLRVVFKVNQEKT